MEKVVFSEDFEIIELKYFCDNCWKCFKSVSPEEYRAKLQDEIVVGFSNGFLCNFYYDLCDDCLKERDGCTDLTDLV